MPSIDLRAFFGLEGRLPGPSLWRKHHSRRFLRDSAVDS